MHSILFVTLMCLFGSGSINAEIFSSYVHLREAVRTVIASNDVSILKRYIAEQRAHIGHYRQVLGLHMELAEMLKAGNVPVDNPIAAEMFARQTSSVLANAKVVENMAEPVLDKTPFVTRSNETFIPTFDDLDGSITGLMRLQDMHQLSTTGMANGDVAGFKTKPLNMLECLEIAKRAQFLYKGLRAENPDSFRKGIAISWLNAAEIRVSSEQEARIFLEVSTAVYESFQCQCTTDNLDRVRFFAGKYPQLNASTIRSCSVQHPVRCQSFPVRARKHEMDRDFDALCRGETVRPSNDLEYQPTPRHRLRCRYLHKNDPNLLLRPAKMEEMNLAFPYVAILHDVIDQSEMETLKQTAMPHLARGTVRRLTGQVVSETKVSQQYLVPLNVSRKICPKLRRRLAGATGLHLRSFEGLLVVNYGTGGYYNIHIDLFSRNVLSTFNATTDNRLATMVFYLDDVIAGGETAFPLLGFAVKPKKGNALLFYNLKRNGGLIEDSAHSSCPIIYGEKWIANQWVLRNGQEFNYPCSKNRAM